MGQHFEEFLQGGALLPRLPWPNCLAARASSRAFRSFAFGRRKLARVMHWFDSRRGQRDAGRARSAPGCVGYRTRARATVHIARAGIKIYTCGTCRCHTAVSISPERLCVAGSVAWPRKRTEGVGALPRADPYPTSVTEMGRVM